MTDAYSVQVVGHPGRESSNPAADPAPYPPRRGRATNAVVRSAPANCLRLALATLPTRPELLPAYQPDDGA